MCTTCGCGASHDHDDHGDHDHGDHVHHEPHAHEPPRRRESSRIVSIERQLLAKNAQLAADNRRRLDASGIAVFNLIGAPGAGKTALLEATIRGLGRDVALSVLEGDQATDRDARRIESAGCRVIQINTGAGCHLDASMVADGLTAIAPPPKSVVFVENVGNLVCPALFDLGERLKVVVMSVAEGDDKPLKYPHVFGAADMFVLTKTDLLPHVVFDEARCMEYARSVNPTLRCIRVSAKTAEGIDTWCEFIRTEASRTGATA
jgi:hydrogenase nickel incorporation protein HypB